MELPATPPASPRQPRYGQGYQNLRRYLREARLPDMKIAGDAPPLPPFTMRVPPDDFLLSPEPDSRRRLRQVLHLPPAIHYRDTVDWVAKHIPNKTTLMPGAYSGHGLDMRLPASSFSIPYEEPERFADMHGMSDWFDLPLLTAERAVRMVWPDQLKDFCFTTQINATEDEGEYVHEDEDSDIYRTYCLRQDDNVEPDDIYNSPCKILIAAVAPWALSTVDINDFYRVKNFPAFSIDPDNTTPPLSRSHKLWAKLWDDCTSKRCRYFVVSVYHRWVFGVFTRGWTTAIVTPPINHTAHGPSVLECLVYWIAAAMEIPGTWTAPKLDNYPNPDIRNVHNVATKLSTPDNIDRTHEEWIEQYHRTKRGDDAESTTLFDGVNWFTHFD